VAHKTIAAVRKLEVLHHLEKGVRLQLDCLRQWPSDSRSQDICQWSSMLPGWRRGKTLLFSFMTYRSLLERFWQASTPASIRRPSYSVITHFPA
jgi:hypothetical protein